MKTIRFEQIFFLIILFLGALLRLYQLGSLPYGITNDEVSYIYSAYSIWNTGKDILGNFMPLSFNIRSSLSPVPVYLTAPFVGLFDLNQFFGRLPFAVSGIGTIIITFLLARRLTRNIWISLASMGVIAFSAWHIHLSRAAYDGVIALFFISLAIYLFLRITAHASFIWSLPFFFLGFYSYHGTKVFILFYILFLLFYFRKNLLQKKKDTLLFIGGVICIFVTFFYVLTIQGVSRQSVFIWNDTAAAERVVNEERVTSTAPELLRKLFSNKVFFYIREIRENYLEAFSLNYLFLYGDSIAIYNVYDRGAFYSIELIFVLAGIIYFVRTKDKQSAGLFLLISLLLAPLPSAFTVDRNYAVRSIMLIPFFSILIGTGMYFLFINLIKLSILKHYGVLCMLAAVWVIQILFFLYQYYFRYPVYGAEAWFRSHKIAVTYLAENRKKYTSLFVSVPTSEFILQYAFVTKLDPEIIQKSWRQGDDFSLSFQNIHFQSKCVSTIPADALKYEKDSTLYMFWEGCRLHSTPDTVITDVKDTGKVLWSIYQR